MRILMKKLLVCLLCAALLSGLAGTAFADTAESDYFLLTAEYGRLYRAPYSGGDAELLADAYTFCYVRDGSSVLASFEDGTIRRIDPAGGSSEMLVSAPGIPIHELIPLTGGFISISYSLREGMRIFLYDAASGSYQRVFEGRNLNYLCSAGNLLVFVEYGEYGTDPTLTSCNPLTGETLWQRPLPKHAEPQGFNGELYLFYPNTGTLEHLDPVTGSRTPVDIPLKDTDYSLLYAGDGCYLVSGNYLDSGLFLIRNGLREKLTVGEDDYASLKDAAGGKLLFYHSKYFESPVLEDSWYSADHYYVLDPEGRNVREIPVKGQYGKLFADGDFPVMDSSTARKPVTAALYSFFCESTGAGGAVPLCSTTHNAWLNIADRTVDIALLAAPTQEEQDYLAEKGVSVEMKLYGGDGLVFIGNHACGVDDLTLDQVRAIYRGEITNWAQLGGADHPIRVLFRDDQSGSQRLFERMLWKDEPVPDLASLGFDRLDDMSTIVSQCLYDPYAIGYSIMTYLSDVYGNEDLLAYSLNGYDATPENVASHNYPLSTQGYVVIRSDEAEDSPARRLFNWFGSPLSDHILVSNGITPLSE